MVQSSETLNDLMLAGVTRMAGDAASGPIIEVTSQGHHASFSLFGAHILNWRPAGQRPVLWLSDGSAFDQERAIRGGIPICWPWFAGHPDHPDWMAHGFARVTRWHLDHVRETDRGARLQFSLPIEDWHAPYWPHTSRPTVRYHVSDTLDVELETANADPHDIYIREALHSYFAVSSVAAVRITGLERSPFADKLIVDVNRQHCQAEGLPIVIEAEIDRIYGAIPDAIHLTDDRLARTIIVQQEGASNAIVWNPWIEKSARMGDMGDAGAYAGMVCIETGNVGADEIRLRPGERHRLLTRIAVRTAG